MVQAWGGASKEHQDGVYSLIQDFIQRGYTVVMADYPGYTQPPTLGRHAPDVIAILGEHVLIGEAKTADDLATDRTTEQVIDFTSFRDATLVLSLPAECRGSKECSAVLLWAIIGRAEVVYRPSLRVQALRDAINRMLQSKPPFTPGA